VSHRGDERVPIRPEPKHLDGHAVNHSVHYCDRLISRDVGRLLALPIDALGYGLTVTLPFWPMWMTQK
jgi:hypothetical protein